MLNIIEKIISAAYYFACICCVVMLLLTFEQVVARYFFSASSTAFQELEWHLFGIVFLLSSAYALKNDTHVRVDIFYSKFSDKTKCLVNTLYLACFLIPATTLIIYHGYQYTLEAYSIGEVSPNPGGLGARWVIKALIPLSFILLALQAFAELIKLRQSWNSNES